MAVALNILASSLCRPRRGSTEPVNNAHPIPSGPTFGYPADYVPDPSGSHSRFPLNPRLHRSGHIEVP